MAVRSTIVPAPTPDVLLAQATTHLASAIDVLTRLSNQINRPNAAPVLPSRTRPVQTQPLLPSRTPRIVASNPTPAPSVRRSTPVSVPQQPVKRTRKQGAAEQIVAAVTRPTGALFSELKDIASYVGPAVLDRLAATHKFSWYTKAVANGDTRVIANYLNKPRRSRA